MKDKIYKFTNGVRVLNCTKHALNFKDGDQTVVVEPSGLVIDAIVSEKTSPYRSVLYGAEIVAPQYISDDNVTTKLNTLRDKFSEIGERPVIFVGSQIAAQAYFGYVAALVPVEGHERVQWDKKLMRSDKFTMF